MPEHSKQNIDPHLTSLMPSEKFNIMSPYPPGEPTYFEYPSASHGGHTYPEYSYPQPIYLHYPYPPPAYALYSQALPPYGRDYPVYAYPLPLITAIRQLPKQYLKVLTRPRVATFAQEKQRAAWNIIGIQLAFIAIIGGLFGFANYAYILPTIFSYFHITRIGAFDVVNAYRGQALSGGLNALISTPISVFISWTILYFVAKGFKGRGEFIEYIYCSTLYYIPMQIIGDLLALIPLVGLILSTLISIYTPVLTILMTMAVHQLSAKRASLAVLIIPICAVLVLIGSGLVFFIFFSLFRSIL